jgi:NAD(P)-dependent dehydrogenase (short-subunit alcohol dehydrogenase family)/acyl-CoA thioesterase FadM
MSISQINQQTGSGPIDWQQAVVLLLTEEGEEEISQALAARLTRLGAQARPVSYAEALEEKQPLGPFTHLVSILPRWAGPAEDTRRQLAGMVRRLATTVTALEQPGRSAVRTVAFVQFGGGWFGTAPTPAAPQQCCTSSFARSLHLERPDHCIRVIDLAATIPPEQIADLVLGELSSDNDPFAAVGYAADLVRRVPRVRLQQPAHYVPRPLQWSANDVILVTGGAKGITAECSLALARMTGARFALVGSSPAPEGPVGELARNLERFQSEQHAFRYYACDLTDGQAVAELVQRVREELGPISAVIHGAGANKPRRLEQVTENEALAEVSPKLLGALHLCQALATAPPWLFVGLTSIIGVTGMPGNGWYAFSNEALDLVLRRFEVEHPGTKVVSIAYSVWGETGMGARMGSVHQLARKGIGAIPTEEGVRRFLQLFTHDPGDKQVVVTARLSGLDTWPVEPLLAPVGFRFIDQVVRAHPGVELVARTRLTLERDRYVQDHVYRGSYLFPTVFGLEAMAQAAACLTGDRQPSIARIEDIRLERPIVVDPRQGVEIEVHAELLEETASGERPIRVGIRSEQTGFAFDHFAAVLVLAELPSGPKVAPRENTVPLDIDPLTDLYGRLLFQGPLFQRMGRIHELDSSHTVFESESRANPFLLGDPFFRDVLLQAGQVTIPREVCLPIRIEKIERFQSAGPSHGHRWVVAPEKVRHGREYRAEVYATNDQGQVVERLSGYWLRILEEHPEGPTAEELAQPEARDERLLRQALDTGCREMELSPMAIALGHLPGLQGLGREERSQREQPVIERAVRTRLNVPPEQECLVQVDRLPSGKPVFDQAPKQGLELSLSHDETYCLCTVATAAVGCDLQPVQPRTADEWQGLLGNHRDELLRDLASGGDTIDRAGIRIWSAVEAVRKAKMISDVELVIEKRAGAVVLLRAREKDGETWLVLTMPNQLTRGPERMVAIATGGSPVAKQTVAGRTGINPAHYGVSVAHDGPQGQPVQELRFIVSFQESSSLSRHVPASRYLAWIGRMRELSTLGNLPELVPLISSGEWGLVTNSSEVRVCGEATAGDVVQMRFWTNHVRGSSELEFFCDFWKVQPEGPAERLAFAGQKATWVRLLDHGQVAPEPLPPAFSQFVERMGPRNNQPTQLPARPEPLAGLDLGRPLYKAHHGPGTAPVLWTDTFETTLEESNLVGNVYFANYFAWQGKVRDLFLHAVAPELLRGVGSRGELIGLSSRVDYLREAMPLDQIEVVMSLRSASECGVVLGYEYFRSNPNGGRLKLAVGLQEMAWVVRTRAGSPHPRPFPEVLRRALLDGTRRGATPPKEDRQHAHPTAA